MYPRACDNLQLGFMVGGGLHNKRKDAELARAILPREDSAGVKISCRCLGS